MNHLLVNQLRRGFHLGHRDGGTNHDIEGAAMRKEAKTVVKDATTMEDRHREAQQPQHTLLGEWY